MRFTREDFDTMVQEVLYTKPSKYDALCRMAEATLRPLVKGWCRNDATLRNRDLEDDLMQSLQLHLMKTVVHGFLKHSSIEEGYNDDPEGFEHWMMKVANNFKRDFTNRIRRVDFRTVQDSEEALVNVAASDGEDFAQRQEELQTLRRAFNIVMESDSRVYIVLTWLAQVIFIVEKGLAHHKANDLLVAAFENQTLNTMYRYIVDASSKIEWMHITPAQDCRIRAALNRPCADGLTYGEVKYKEFFMKNRGEIDGKKSVSDWINRVNGRIGKRVAKEAQKPPKKSDSSTEKGTKRRDEDGSSNVG